MKDILLDENNDIKTLNGDFDTHESEMQEVALILQSVQGEWKQSPLLGPNLYQFIKGKTDKVALDEKDFENLKTKIETQIKNDG